MHHSSRFYIARKAPPHSQIEHRAALRSLASTARQSTTSPQQLGRLEGLGELDAQEGAIMTSVSLVADYND